MKILNFGSLNMDIVFSVDQIVTPGRTISASSMHHYIGGKGLNQSIAVSRAGHLVYHAGMVGNDGKSLVQLLKDNQVDCGYVKEIDEPSGTAFIQVSESGENSIIVYGGANHCITKEYVDYVLGNFQEDDFIILQNEISNLPYIIDQAYKKQLFIVLNPSPINNQISYCNLRKVSLLIVNEDEAYQLTGKRAPDEILGEMMRKYPNIKVLLTLGSKGAIFQNGSDICRQEACKVKVVDTTSAGDTFLGYFIALLAEDTAVEEAMDFATKAAALTITKKGASNSIPTRKEVIKFMNAGINLSNR